jgi:hypothetical protein
MLPAVLILWSAESLGSIRAQVSISTIVCLRRHRGSQDVKSDSISQQQTVDLQFRIEHQS